MKRRSVLSLALGALALPAVAGTGVRFENGDTWGVAVLRTDLRLVRVQAVSLGGGLGLRWRGGAPIWNEERFDLSHVSGLFRQPFARRWEVGRTLGVVAATSDALTAELPGAAGLEGRRVVLGVDGVSWDLPGVLAPVGGPRGGEIMGEARLGADGVVLIQLAGWAAL